MSKLDLLAASPLISLASPTTATITSDAAATVSASANNSCGLLLSIDIFSPNTFILAAKTGSSDKLAPFAYITLEPIPGRLLKPSNTPIDADALALIDHVPNILDLSLASGPMSAIF